MLTSRLRRLSAAIVPMMAFVFVAGFGSVVAGPASAAPAGPLSCGAVITHSTTLTADLGPCAGDGIDIGASGITLNLNGHTITGSHAGTAIPTTQQVGVNLTNVNGVTVKGGTVALFDAGVAINAGSSNTVTRMDVHDNINYNLVYNTGNNDVNLATVTPQQYTALRATCSYGDGITTDNSVNNLITRNTATHNGPYSGISLVDASGNNVARANQVSTQTVVNVDPTGKPTVCGASYTLGHGMQLGRNTQDVGIRVEGPGANGNRVASNVVSDSELAGISINSYVCHSKLPARPDEVPNLHDAIVGNTVTGTGADTHQLDPDASGIHIFSAGPNGTTTCPSYDATITHNTSNDNFQDGITVGALSHDNTVSSNTTDNNGRDGIHLEGPFTSTAPPPNPTGAQMNFPGATNNTLRHNQATGNGEFDAADLNPGCDHNAWDQNDFGSVNQTCVLTNQGVNQVVNTGASGSATNQTLTTDWSAPVTVANPGGFTVYSDSACNNQVGTGQAVVSGDGSFAPVISLDAAPPPSTRSSPAYYEVAPGSLYGPGGIYSPAVGCRPVSFSGPPAPATSMVSATSVTCGTTGVGVATNCMPTVTITNTSPAGSGKILNFTDPVLTSTNGDFTQAGGTCAPGVLNPGTSCTVIVRFTPAPGQTGTTQTGTVTINDNGTKADTLAATGMVS